MDPWYHLLYTIFVCFGGITVFFAPLGLISCKLCLQTVHFNLRVLTLSLGVLWILFSIGSVMFCFILDAEEDPPQLYQYPKYQYAKMLAAASGYSFRVLETSISFERLLATIYFKRYERVKIFRVYSFIAIIVSLFFGFCFAFLFNILKLPAMVVYVFLITVETINFFLLRKLLEQNKLLRQLSYSNRTPLSSKYQLTENIRSLNLLFPQATISFIFSNFTIVSTFIIGTFHEPNRAPIFLSLYCLNVIALSIYWMCRLEKTTKKISKFWKLIFKRFYGTSRTECSVQTLTVKTTLGQSIKKNQTVDEHFVSLKNVWQ